MSGCRSSQAYCLLALLVYVTDAGSHVSRLRAGLHMHSTLRQEPPLGVAAGPASSAAAKIADMFARMDVNKDGKVDENEFVVAQQNGVLPLAAAATAPAPAPFSAASPGPALPVAGAAPAPSVVEDEILPPHLMKPPPLPGSIPEPPPPPRAPPAEPQPPPLPPREGQLVGPPPSEHSMEAAGNVTAMVAGVPGLDLDGNNPLEAPNTPPPIPAPLMPPDMPQIQKPMAPPGALDPALMSPQPVAFARDVARTLPGKEAALGVVSMP